MKLPKGVKVHIGRRRCYTGEIPDEVLDKNPKLKKSVEVSVDKAKKAEAKKKAAQKKAKGTKTEPPKTEIKTDPPK